MCAIFWHNQILCNITGFHNINKKDRKILGHDAWKKFTAFVKCEAQKQQNVFFKLHPEKQANKRKVIWKNNINKNYFQLISQAGIHFIN